MHSALQWYSYACNLHAAVQDSHLCLNSTEESPLHVPLAYATRMHNAIQDGHL